MPKLKTNKSAAKRFKPTGSGGFKHRRTNRNHILTKKAKNRKRKLRQMKLVNAHDQKEVNLLINGG